MGEFLILICIFDISACSAYDYKITAKGKALIKTDIQIELPSGCYGRVAPRSGLAHKHFLDVGAGVIDEDYRGNVGVILFNFSEVDYEVGTSIDIKLTRLCSKILSIVTMKVI